MEVYIDTGQVYLDTCSLYLEVRRKKRTKAHKTKLEAASEKNITCWDILKGISRHLLFRLMWTICK